MLLLCLCVFLCPSVASVSQILIAVMDYICSMVVYLILLCFPLLILGGGFLLLYYDNLYSLCGQKICNRLLYIRWFWDIADIFYICLFVGCSYARLSHAYESCSLMCDSQLCGGSIRAQIFVIDVRVSVLAMCRF